MKRKRRNKKMSKNIKPSKEFIEGCKNDFLQLLLKGCFASGEVSFKRTFAVDTKQKASLTFTELAWQKMHALVREYSSEIAWHGICKREELEEGAAEIAAYRIEDILVYPQTVTGTTASSDDDEYPMWMMSQPDEIFNHIRFQGHSHVNMGVTPSSVDRNFYDEILGQMKEDDFYVFAIINKKDDRTILIYDYKINQMFETKDVNVYIEKEPNGVERLLDEAKKMVKKQPVTTTYPNLYNYGNYNNYGVGKTASTVVRPTTAVSKKGTYNKETDVIKAGAIPGFTEEEIEEMCRDPFFSY